MPSSSRILDDLPLVGRASELAELLAALEEAAAGRGSTRFLVGDRGVGKSRVAERVAAEASERGWTVASGRGYPVEAGVPYALFSDALLPILRQVDPATLTVLTRGGEAELAYLFPALGGDAGTLASRFGDDPVELKTRLLWNFAELLKSLASRNPLLIIFDDLHWADQSSLELLHFVARQTTGDRILFLCTLSVAEHDRSRALQDVERSLLSMKVARAHELRAFTHAETGELVGSVFGVDASVAGEFTALLHGWTRGNPFFLIETLKGLVESGRVRERDGTWLGWEVKELELPETVREVVAARLSHLGSQARSVAELAAVLGARARYEPLRHIVDLPERDLLEALDELRRAHLMGEADEEGDVVYDFTHPLIRESLYAEIGLARTRQLHGVIAQALERFYGRRAVQHSDELAYHYARAKVRDLAPKAARYLAAAGRNALERYANREAASYLAAALERLDQATAPGPGGRTDPGETVPGGAQALVVDLARAHQRLGEYDTSLQLWRRVLAVADQEGDAGTVARIHLRIALALFWSGRHEEALVQYEAGIQAARHAGRPEIRAAVQLARGICLEEAGRPDDAEKEILAALRIAEELGDVALLARAHRSLALLYTWTGLPDQVREHGQKAIELAAVCGDPWVAFWSHWTIAVLEGLTGNISEMARQLEHTDAIASELHSPRLKIWSTEMHIELASATGDWDSGIALGERAIALARSLNQNTLLPRLLVWSALIYLGRGNIGRARELVDEAWETSGAGESTEGVVDVHTVVPAHVGRASVLLAEGSYDEAIRVGEAGLAIAERTGYVIWTVHRLLPTLAETYIRKRDLEGAKRTGRHLRRNARKLGHRLGLAWADACDALVQWLEGDSRAASVTLLKAAEALEAIPMIPDAARLRRQLAGRLVEIGDDEGAVGELRRVHDVFSRLGAERELEKTRAQLRDLGARPPIRTAGTGPSGLTAREVEIARLVAERRSNKAIGRILAISPRTVSTHLSNIFRKLELTSRGELADFVRERGLPPVE